MSGKSVIVLTRCGVYLGMRAGRPALGEADSSRGSPSWKPDIAWYELDDFTREFLLAEYKSLRDEIHKRTEMQQILVVATLTAAGVYLPVAFEVRSPLMVLLYPLLAFF